MILLPASSAYVAEIAPPEKRGAYMGLYLMCFSLAFAIGPWLGAVVLDARGGRCCGPRCFSAAVCLPPC